MNSVIVGCDVGGTFTDLILLDRDSGDLRLAKVPTTVHNQAEGVIHAVEQTGIAPEMIGLFIHGTTATTNAMLERKLSRCGLITTRGFRDTLELGRRTRPNPYGLISLFEPLIPRDLRIEVTERLNARGEVLKSLDEEEVRQAALELLEKGAESVVIHFLHSYADPIHELRAESIVRSVWSNAYVTVGHKIVAEYREYERGVTAAVNGSVQPILHRYIGRLEKELSSRGFDRQLLIMQGNGGTASAQIATDMAVQTVMSGPASGVIAAAHSAAGSDFKNVITYDMGGTSTDVAIIKDGLPMVSSELELEYGMPIHVPMVDVHTVGAGGGSIAWVNNGEMLEIGPRSAGARPGPVCFGRGGNEPTITDANLVLGRLNPTGLLAVENGTTREDVEAIFADTIGSRLGLDGVSAAAAVLRIANDRMAGAIRLVSLSRGNDPRDFCLFAFGGAGPLHAVALARELGVPYVMIPARPGLTNAFGCLVADLRHDFVRTINRPLSALSDDDITTVLTAQIEEGRNLIALEHAGKLDIEVMHSVDMQFLGQSHVLNVRLDGGVISADKIGSAFAKTYWARFEIDMGEVQPVVVNLNTAVLGRRERIPLSVLASSDKKASVEEAKIGSRDVWFETGWHETPVYSRDLIPLRFELDGPAILEQLDTTVVIDPDNHAYGDGTGNILIKIDGAR